MRKEFTLLVCVLLTLPLIPNISGEKVTYTPSEAREKQYSHVISQLPIIDEQNIIIAPPRFYTQAKNLEIIIQ
jgi:hypothetical protein